MHESNYQQLKTWTWSSVALLMLMTQAACSAKQDQAAEKPTAPVIPPSQVTEPAPAAPAELVFYATTNDSDLSFDTRIGNLLRKKFPQHTIKYMSSANGNNMAKMLSTGTKFDIFYHSIGNFETAMIPNNLHFDMNELIKKYKLDWNRFDPTLATAVRQPGGEIYGVPVWQTNLVTLYNKSLFDKFGVSYPTDDMTWDDAAAASKKLTRTEDGVQYIGLSTSPTHMMKMNQFSLPYVDAKTNEPTINSLPNWKTLFDKVLLAPGNPNYPQVDEFARKRVLAMFTYLSSLPTVIPNDFKGLEWNMVALPTFKELPKIGSQGYPTYFGITKTAVNKDAAMEVIAYLTSDEVQKHLAEGGDIPVIKNEQVRAAFASKTGYTNINWKAVFHHSPAPIAYKSIYDAVVEANYISDAANPLVQGKTDMNTAFRTAAEKAKLKIDEAKK